MNEPRLKFNVSTGEFECSGPTEYIDSKVKEFRDIMLAIAETKKIVDPRMIEAEGTNPKRPESKETRQPIQMTPEDLDIFSVADAGSSLHLRILPDGSGDAAKQGYSMLVLLLGFKKYLGKDEVLAMTLADCLRKSGAGIIKRLDRAAEFLMVPNNLITASGQRAGKKYRLTTPGITKAEELRKAMAAKLK